MKTVAFVPIKLNNQRTPGKNIKRFDDGMALLTVFLKTLVQVRGIDEIYVFCSNKKIKEYLIPGVSFLKRPAYLDTQQATPQDIISEFMQIIEADIYMVSHCTSPFVTVKHFEECIAAVKSGSHDSSFTAEKIQKLLWGSDNKPLNFEADNVPRTQDLKPIYDEVSAAYVFRKEVFTKLHRRIGVTPHLTEVTGIECIDIDYPEDFEIANAIYMNILKKNRLVSIKKRIKFFVMDVDGTLTDGKIYMGAHIELFKAFDIKDGCGIKDILPQYNIVPIVITARESNILSTRCKELGIQYIYQGIHDKLQKLEEIISSQSIRDNIQYTFENVAYIGDDILDLQCMKPIKLAGGIVGCPADASEQVKDLVHYQCEKKGGNGAVREFIEWLISDKNS